MIFGYVNFSKIERRRGKLKKFNFENNNKNFSREKTKNFTYFWILQPHMIFPPRYIL